MSQHDGNEGAAHDECIVIDTGEGDDVWNPFDEFHDEVDLAPEPKVLADDGMPTNFAPYDDERSDIPPLGPDTLVCIGVFTEFVVRNDWGEIIARVPGDVVEQTPSGRWRVRRSRFIQHNPDPHPKWKVRKWIEEHLAGNWIEVEPIRPPCRHYVRQLAPYHHNPRHRKAFRLCAARRTTEGTFMDVSDMGMYACDMRQPRVVESEKHMNKFDQTKMREGQSRRYLSLFKDVDPDQEPDQEGAGGIFNG